MGVRLGVTAPALVALGIGAAFSLASTCTPSSNEESAQDAGGADATLDDAARADAAPRASADADANVALIDGGPDADDDMVRWWNCELPADEHIAVHAEHRDAGATTWENVTQVFQPFRSAADPASPVLYWRKDDPANDYGEIYTYDETGIYLRMETFPFFPSVDPAGSWDPRPDKFRLFVQAEMGLDPRPYGTGRLLAPRRVDTSWSVARTLHTFRCTSWTDFASGACAVYQQDFQDTRVALEVRAPFDTVFDGENAAWPADIELRSFDRAVVIVQEMYGTAGRERFFFAEKGGVHYGLVRWDSSITFAGQWTVVDRTVGLKRTKDPKVNLSGMPARAAHDLFPSRAGLRVLETTGKTQRCPAGLVPSGTVTFDPNGTGGFASDVYDLSGYHTTNGAKVALCTRPGAASVVLTPAAACAPGDLRGSIFAKSAVVATSPSNDAPLTVTEDWVAVCARPGATSGTTTRTGDVACPAGTSPVGSFVSYKDGYDGAGKRCAASGAGQWLVLCADP